MGILSEEEFWKRYDEMDAKKKAQEAYEQQRSRLIQRAKQSIPDYMNLVVMVRSENPSWRKGQTYFNVLHAVRPDIAELIRGTECDPFHRDDRIRAFLKTVQELM